MYVFFFFSILQGTLVHAASRQIPTQNLIEFSQSKQWLSYLQFYPESQSRISPGSQFFLSTKGSTDPLSELQASLDVFTADTEKTLKNICLLPARYKMLRSHFHFPEKVVDCPRLNEFSQRYSHQRAQIIFAGQYGSSPGSIMGHTLIKFVDDHREDYLHFTFGYMADVPDSVSGIEYSYKGIFGGFKGYFVAGPYYEKIFEYNNIENRDVWEYDLLLTKEQNQFLLHYIYELHGTAEIDYFFAGRNCAYILLAALQTVRPEKNLLEQMHFYVLPIETVKVLKLQGLIGNVRYRPSQQRILTERLARLTNSQMTLFDKSLAEQKLLQNTEVEVVEALMDYVNFLRYQNAGELSADWQNFENALLVARSQFTSAAIFTIATPTDVLNGHGPFRIKAFAGIDEFKKTIRGFELRPGVHGMLENPIGYLPRSSLDFLVTEFSKRDDQDWQISHITFFDFALTPEYTRFFPKWSWQIKGEWTREINSLDFQLGATLDLNHSWRMGILADALAQQSSAFERHYRFWLGPAPFLIYNYPNIGQAQISYKALKDLVEGNSIDEFIFEGRLYNFFPHFSLECSLDRYEQRMGIVYDFSW